MVADSLPLAEGQDHDLKAWFNEMLSNLRFDKLLTKKNIFNLKAAGNLEALNFSERQLSSACLIAEIVQAYFKELIKSDKKPNELGLKLYDSKILICAEVLQDDEEMEDLLILAEAKANAYSSKFGYSISSTIVEECDGLKMPNHYKKVRLA